MTTINNENINIIKSIPAIPPIFNKINEAIKEQVNLNDNLILAIEEDEKIKNDIIKLSNSRYFISGQNLNSIRAIILTLGVMKVKNMIMTLSLKEMMDLNNNNFRDLWEHSIKCAVSCEILANEYNIISPEDAFALGFLHDIGKVMIYKNNAEKFYEFNHRVQTQEEDIIELENSYFNANHSTEGAMILKKWQMPRILTDCIMYHHTPTLSTIPAASGIIYVSDKIVQSEKQVPQLENSILNRLGLYITDVKNLKMNIDVKSSFYFEAIS